MPQEIVPILVVAGVAVTMTIVMLIVMRRAFHEVEPGQALIINTPSRTIVSFNRRIVVPIIHRAEVMDISLKTVTIDMKGGEGLICQDNIRADIRVRFLVRVNPTEHDVLKVAKSIGCAQASSQETIEALFTAKFTEALKTVGKKFEFERLNAELEMFKDRLFQVIGEDLNGFVFEDLAVDYLEQTPIGQLDPNNILDASGMKKLLEIQRRTHAEITALGGASLLADPPSRPRLEDILPQPREAARLRLDASSPRGEAASQTVTVTLEGDTLTFVMGAGIDAPRLSVDLSEKYAVALSHASDGEIPWLQLEVRQRASGYSFSVGLCARADASTRDAIATLPRMEQHFAEVGYEALIELVAALRYRMQAAGAEGWGV